MLDCAEERYGLSHSTLVPAPSASACLLNRAARAVLSCVLFFNGNGLLIGIKPVLAPANSCRLLCSAGSASAECDCCFGGWALWRCPLLLYWVCECALNHVLNVTVVLVAGRCGAAHYCCTGCVSARLIIIFHNPYSNHISKPYDWLHRPRAFGKAGSGCLLAHKGWLVGLKRQC